MTHCHCICLYCSVVSRHHQYQDHMACWLNPVEEDAPTEARVWQAPTTSEACADAHGCSLSSQSTEYALQKEFLHFL